MRQALAVHALVEANRRGAAVTGAGHALHVSAGAEGPARAREHHAAHVVRQLDFGQGTPEAHIHGVRHRVAPVRAVHREDRDSVFDARQKILGTVIDAGDSRSWLLPGNQ